jgi:Protein of unknown function (DUF3365)
MRVFLSVIILFSVIGCESAEEEQKHAIMAEFTLKGDKMAEISFQSLSGNLKAVMLAGGPENAIQFCNLNAQPLTDSLAKTFNVSIKRTSLKLRNADNKPDPLEAYMLDLYLQIEKMKKPMASKTLLTKHNEVRYFAPIVLQAQCLVCHGTVGKEVSDQTYAMIKEHYPNDEAVGFEEGKLRGIWSINFGDFEALKNMGSTVEQ